MLARATPFRSATRHMPRRAPLTAAVHSYSSSLLLYTAVCRATHAMLCYAALRYAMLYDAALCALLLRCRWLAYSLCGWSRVALVARATSWGWSLSFACQDVVIKHHQ